MGCTSSTPGDSSFRPPAVEEKREKKITACTEATSHGGGEVDDTPAATATTATYPSNTKTDKTAAGATTVVAVGELTLRYACKSRRGRDPDDASKPNQDCYSVHHQNVESSSSSSGATTTAFFAVYDGHGPHGEGCSQFVQQRLPELVNQHILRGQDEYMVLTIDQVQESLHKAHTECNDELHASQINDSYSGTTSISLYVHDQSRITVCNVGDSRAILGTSRGTAAGTRLQAVPLSKDQTPHRSDEADRCKRSGARILSFGEIDPNHYDNDSEVEDPPRVWSREGKYPGTAFTRSLGDSVAETLGVFAEPEMMTLKLSPTEEMIVLASDGIFDVMSNQEVIDLCLQHRHDPAQACEAVIEKSHQEWLENEDCVDEQSASYDDMTMICIFIGSDDKETKGGAVSEPVVATAKNENAELPSAAPQQQQQKHSKRVRQKTLRNLEEMEGG